MSTEENSTQKILHEDELYKKVEKKVIDRAINVTVDNGPRGTWPGDILVKAAERLAKESGTGEVTPYGIDRTLEDIVIKDGWGSFYWDTSNKRHLKLNPPGWADRNKKVSSSPGSGFTVGPLV
ncbi:MAG: hypothetical protein ACLP5V_08315 [Candidatus Bathyarchaeia archaeon]